MEEIITKVIAGLAVAIITGSATWFYKRKFSVKYRHNIKHGDLNELLAIIKKEYSDIKSLKVLANVTNIFLPAFQSSKLEVVEVQLLLRKPKENFQDSEEDYKNYFGTIINDWRKLEKNGRIKRLEIKYFDFLTPDWQVIIDDKFIILGLNVPQQDDWKKFEVLETILIAGDSKSGKLLIEKYSDRFDRFYSEYGSKD